MARTKEFDPDVALDAAMDLFWRKGYTSTSTADLVEHLGIARASLYATFGDKHQLYLSALDRYMKTRDPDPVELLSQPGPVLPAIRSLIWQYAQESNTDPKRRGCMVVNAAVERASSDNEVARRIESGWNAVEATITSALFRARAQGELPADANPQRLAHFLWVFMQGLRVFGRAAPDPQRLEDAVDEAMRILT